MGRNQPSANLSSASRAEPEAVYDTLADLSSHLEWSGARQSSDFRLLTLDAPAGPARVGTAFSSTGTIPMSKKHWEDRSTVTAASRPTLFEYVTEAQAGPMRARYQHRYEIAREGSGSRVTYRLTELEVANPWPRMGWPVLRIMTWKMAIPMLAGRGLRNLLSHAEQVSRPSEPVVPGAIHVKES
jgi:polyketide cyclase/dehydrase/lipid transport protein